MCYHGGYGYDRCDGDICYSGYQCESGCCVYYSYSSGCSSACGSLAWLWWSISWFFVICCICMCIMRARRMRMAQMAAQRAAARNAHGNSNNNDEINVVVTH